MHRNTRVLIILLTIFLSFFTFLSQKAAAAEQTYLNVVNPLTGDQWFNFTTEEKSVGDTFIINITVVNVTDLACWQFELQWDSSLLLYVNATLPSDNIFAGKNIVTTNDHSRAAAGLLICGAALLDPTQTYTGSGRLAQVELRIDRRLQPPSPLSFEGIYADTFLLDGGGKEILFTAVNGYYECSAHPATKLSVFSAYGLPIPGVGSWLFDEGDGVTCQIAPYWAEGEVVWVCTGWTGTGSVPPNGNGIMVSFFINENSTITWNWQQLPSINTSLAFSRTSYSFVVGEAFNVTAVIKNVKGLGAWQLALSYDPNVIEYRNVSIPSDNIFKGHDVQLMGPDASIPGYVVLGVGATPGDIFSVDGSGVLCTFTFIGRNAGNSSLAFSNFGVDTFLLNTSSLRDIPFMAQGSSARSVMFHGDVDNDGDVNMRDVSEAILAFNSFPGMTRWNPYADLDNSDRVDMRDLVIIVLNFNQHE